MELTPLSRHCFGDAWAAAMILAGRPLFKGGKKNYKGVIGKTSRVLGCAEASSVRNLVGLLTFTRKVPIRMPDSIREAPFLPPLF